MGSIPGQGLSPHVPSAAFMGCGDSVGGGPVSERGSGPALGLDGPAWEEGRDCRKTPETDVGARPMPGARLGCWPPY